MQWDDDSYTCGKDLLRGLKHVVLQMAELFRRIYEANMLPISKENICSLCYAL